MKIDELLKQAYDNSYYTIVGCGGDLNTWKKGYEKLLDLENIGTISEWIQFTGKDVNSVFDLKGDNRFKDNLIFLAFPINNLDTGKLAIFKLKMHDRWFDDIINNSI